MATKVLTGDYFEGYKLSKAYSSVDVTSSAYIGGYGLDVSGLATIANAGTIHGVFLLSGKLTNTGEIDGSVSSYGAQLKNSGTIIGDGPAGYGVGMAYGSSMTNSGLIEGQAGTGTNPGGVAILVHYGVTVLTNSGDIVGGQGGASGHHGAVGGTGVYLGSIGTILNSGTIAGGSSVVKPGYGVAIREGGNVTNGSATAPAATVSGNVGVSFGAAGTIINFGTIAGQGGPGITFAAGGMVTNGSATIGAALIEGYVGVEAAGASPVTMTNFGTIQGSGGVAVQFTSATDRLIVEAGSMFDGAVRGGVGTLELGSGKGTIKGLNAVGTLAGGVTMTFSGFGSYALDPGANWTLEGKNSLSSGETLTDAGSLTVDGKLVNSGLMEASGVGVLTISGQVANSGIISASGGTVTVTGTITGKGDVSIDGGDFDFASSASVAVTFVGAAGVLELGQSQTSAVTVTGFSNSGDTSLDLSDIGFVSAGEATFSGTKKAGILTVTDGSHTALVTLKGNYLNSTFTASSDGHGGTLVVAGAGTGSVPPHAFIAAMASLTSPPAHADYYVSGAFAPVSSLSRPGAALA
jgi:hypothetical protein